MTTDNRQFVSPNRVFTSWEQNLCSWGLWIPPSICAALSAGLIPGLILIPTLFLCTDAFHFLPLLRHRSRPATRRVWVLPEWLLLIPKISLSWQPAHHTWSLSTSKLHPFLRQISGLSMSASNGLSSSLSLTSIKVSRRCDNWLGMRLKNDIRRRLRLELTRMHVRSGGVYVDIRLESAQKDEQPSEE